MDDTSKLPIFENCHFAFFPSIFQSTEKLRSNQMYLHVLNKIEDKSCTIFLCLDAIGKKFEFRFARKVALFYLNVAVHVEVLACVVNATMLN